MKILLLGEYSNVHATLAKGLRALGHEVTVASSGDGWKNYPRDIDMKRESLGFWSSLRFLLRTYRQFRKFRGYDIVQLINPVFVDLRAEKLFSLYNYLRRHNRHLVMGAFGMDHYYAKACLDFQTFRYSDFNKGNEERESAENEIFKQDWIDGEKGRLNRLIAADCDAIVTGLYEYQAAYEAHFKPTSKLHFIPFPIVLPEDYVAKQRHTGDPVRLFIGIQKARSEYKGTDIMLRAAERVAQEMPTACILKKVENLPFAEYTREMNASEVILDQLYSYTPAMNALEAMARGLINVGGAEPENYEILDEDELRPIINVEPTEESVYEALRKLVIHRDEWIPRMQKESRAYIAKHHDYLKVARQYEAMYRSLS